MQARLSRLVSFAAAVALATPLAAAPRPILDYRKPAPEARSTVPATARAALAEALASARGASGAGSPGGDLVVLDHARGAFTGAGKAEELYLLADQRPVAAEPFPRGPGQVLAVLNGSEVAAAYSLPADQRYQRIAGTVDSDRDGRSEVLLETGSYNMGQSVTSVDLVGLGPDRQAAIRQSLGEVAYDGCDNPRGKREKRVSTVTLAQNGQLVARSHVLRCR